MRIFGRWRRVWGEVIGSAAGDNVVWILSCKSNGCLDLLE